MCSERQKKTNKKFDPDGEHEADMRFLRVLCWFDPVQDYGLCSSDSGPSVSSTTDSCMSVLQFIEAETPETSVLFNCFRGKVHRTLLNLWVALEPDLRLTAETSGLFNPAGQSGTFHNQL